MEAIELVCDARCDGMGIASSNRGTEAAARAWSQVDSIPYGVDAVRKAKPHIDSCHSLQPNVALIDECQCQEEKYDNRVASALLASLPLPSSLPFFSVVLLSLRCLLPLTLITGRKDSCRDS